MDYEKMYKEAVGKIQELLEEKKKKEMTNCLFEGELNEIFSELRESEEEKIRKRIILCLEECVHNDIIRDYEKEQCLAWLEKPKTEKVYLRFKVGDVVCSSNGTTLKIVGITDYCYNCTTTEGNVYSFSFDIQDEFVLVEDKKEWSEEDERMYKAISIALTLKDAKWYLSTWYKIPEEADYWLKTLKERYTWKPSEAQLVVLDDIIKNAHLSNANKTILIKLYNDLKKL